MLLENTLDLLIKKNGVAICSGIASKKVKYNGDAIDITSDDDNGYRTSLTASSTRSVDVTFDGIEKDSIISDFVHSGARVISGLALEWANGDYYYGTWFLSNFDRDYESDAAGLFSVTLLSSGPLLLANITDPPPSIVWPPDSGKTENVAISYLKQVRGFQYLHEKKGKWDYIDDTGAIGPNKTTPTLVRYQREALWVLRNGLIQANSSYILRASSAFEWAFDFQNPAGYFENGKGYDPVLAIESDTFFINGFTNAYLVIAGQPELSGLAASYAAYAPALASSLAWMNSHTAQIYDDGGDTPNRLFFAAVAFNLAGKILSNTTYKNQGIAFATTAAGMLHVDGYFLEKGGWDSSYQAVSLMNLCALFFHTADASFKTSVKTVLSIGVNWLITRIAMSGDNIGEVSTEGNTRTGPDAPEGKLVNYGEVALCLYYGGFILERLDLIETSNLVVRYAATHPT